MKITKNKLKEIIKEEIENFYSDYDEDPVKALEKRREELKAKIIKSGDMDDVELYKKLGRKLYKLKNQRDN
tara:strand:- start:820 stop:1032 length:213 start_codon:yes stop_codon:yes gene_type:complete